MSQHIVSKSVLFKKKKKKKKIILFNATSEVNDYHAKKQLICDINFCCRVSLASSFYFYILFVRIIVVVLSSS